MNPESQDSVSGRPIGLFGSLKTLATTLLGIGCTRLELLSNEIEEQRVWLSSMLLWTLITLFCAAVGIVLVTIFLVVVFWDTHRLLTLFILAFLFLLGAIFSSRVALGKARAKLKLFSTSLAELSKDNEQLAPCLYERGTD
ncbi:MAG: phage holin family protein [Candidatus Nitrotoga sp.]|nr:phage holin family protein [Candidatus Nitrotoga sp.]